MSARFELAGWLKRWSAPALVLVAALVGCGDEGDGGDPAGRGGSGGTSQPADGGEAGTGAEAGRADGGSGADGAGGASTGGRAGSGARGGSAGTTGEAGGGGQPEPAPFSITLSPASLTLPRGASAWLTVSVERDNGFVDPVTITFDDLPEGFVADTLVLPDGVASGFLPIASSEELTIGSDFELEATGSSGSRATTAPLTLTLAASEPSSQEKIRAALEASMLDYETSLLYRAYAIFGDARLPDAFVGAGSEEEDNGLFDELRRRISGLSTAGQASLRPFLVRPADAESAWSVPLMAQVPAAGKRVLAAAAPVPTSCPEQSGGPGTWISRRSTTESVRVWAQCKGEATGDAESVRLIQKTLGVLHKIYGPMTGLMSYPIEDLEGGDAAIDFYIVDPGGSVVRRGDSFVPAGLGSTFSDFPEVGNGASAFVLLPRSLLYASRFHTTVIHEFFHVLQKAHNHQYSPRELSASNVYVAHWFPEASAVWVSAHFDRILAPWEDGRAAYLDAHQRFTQRFQKSSLALSAPNPVPHTYSAYIWSYFAEQETGSANFMADIWEGLMSASSFEQADDAIDQAFSFREHFKDFALRNLNMSFIPGDPLPRSERYVALDSIFPDGPTPDYPSSLLTRDQEFRQSLEIPNLGTRYVMLTADPLARKVE
ncbi:MAG TPA: hypothetical protein VMS65_02615, partial [Polyangiaceae bacterium]|nr:hypothetical protein [Polyangiaceae bacterium]